MSLYMCVLVFYLKVIRVLWHWSIACRVLFYVWLCLPLCVYACLWYLIKHWCLFVIVVVRDCSIVRIAIVWYCFFFVCLLFACPCRCSITHTHTHTIVFTFCRLHKRTCADFLIVCDIATWEAFDPFAPAVWCCTYCLVGTPRSSEIDGVSHPSYELNIKCMDVVDCVRSISTNVFVFLFCIQYIFCIGNLCSQMVFEILECIWNNAILWHLQANMVLQKWSTGFCGGCGEDNNHKKKPSKIRNIECCTYCGFMQCSRIVCGRVSCCVSIRLQICS